MEALEDFPVYEAGKGVPKIKDPLFEAGFGLTTSKNTKASIIEGLL
jgi:hypothetical protein